MSASQQRGISQSDFEDNLETAWEKTFDIEAREKKLPARIRANVLLGINRPKK